MSLRRFTWMLANLNEIHPVSGVSFQGSGDYWQVDIKFKTDSVSDIFTITLYGKSTKNTINIDLGRVSAPRMDNIHPSILGRIFSALGSFSHKSISLPRTYASVRKAVMCAGFSSYLWAGSIFDRV